MGGGVQLMYENSNPKGIQKLIEKYKKMFDII